MKQKFPFLIKPVKMIILLGIVILGFSFCTNDKPLPSGFEILPRDYKGDLKEIVLKAKKVASFWSIPLAGQRSSLLVGEYNNIKSSCVLALTTSAELSDVTIDKATLSLYQTFHSGEGDSFRVVIYPLIEQWINSGDSAFWNDIQNMYDENTVVGEFKVGMADSAQIIDIDLDPQIVDGWFSDTDSNYGILLKSEQPNFMVHFDSYEGLVTPANLNVIYHNTSNESDTSNFSFIYDTSLLTAELTEPEDQLLEDIDYLRIGNGDGFASFVKFDLDSIPSEISIVQAHLEFQVNTDLTVMNETGIGLVAVPIGPDASWDPDSVNTASSYMSTCVVDPGESVAAFNTTTAYSNMTTVVQSWVYNYISNYGLMIRSSEYGLNANEIFLHTGKTDSSKIPILRILYSVPPSNRFIE